MKHERDGMARLGLAVRLFFRAMRDAAFLRQVEPLLEGKPLPQTTSAPPPTVAVAPPRAQPAPPPRPVRSEALTLLSVLQREARLIDFLKEPIAGYSDAQIGAAVRDIHRDAAAAVERLFGLKPLSDRPEGATIEVPAGFDAARFRLTGNVTGPGPYRGALRHAGWTATKVNVPEWTGNPESANVVAPAEVELT